MQKNILRKQLATAFSEQELRRWFDPLNLTVSEEEQRIDISFPHPFFASWFEDNMRERFERHLARIMGQGWSLSYANNGHGSNRGRHEPEPQDLSYPFGLENTFDSFLSNRKNAFPLATAREVAGDDQAAYNPFVICGEPGSGKTHLAMAVANGFARRVPAESMHVSSGEDFWQTWQTRFGSETSAARTHFASCSVLVLDDLQQIRSRTRFQEDLVFLFDALHRKRHQMVFTCNELISSCSWLIPELRTRLEGGLIVNLRAPDLEVRIRYVQTQCRQRRLVLSPEHVLTLAQRFANLRYLQGVMLKLFAYSKLIKKDIGEADFRHILDNTEGPEHVLEPDTVISVVASHFDVSPEDLKGERRHRQVALPRHMAVYLCRKMLGLSYPALGQIFGGRDHSTILYCVNKIKKLQRDDPETKRLLADFKHKCRQGGPVV